MYVLTLFRQLCNIIRQMASDNHSNASAVKYLNNWLIMCIAKW